MSIIDKEVFEYLENLCDYENGMLGEIQKEAFLNNVPIVPKQSTKFLKVLFSILNPTNVLEIGCAVGFSASLISNYLTPNGKITTIERYEKMIEKAKINFEKQNLLDKIKLVEGDANIVLETLTEKYDVIFMDAAKGQYINILPTCIKLLKVGGVIIADDVLQEGKIAKDINEIERRQRTIHRRMNEFLKTVTSHEALLTSIVPVGDGIVIAKKIKEI